MKPKCVGMITWHHYYNFGSALQAYALQETINKLGYDCEIINYRRNKQGSLDDRAINMRYCISKYLGKMFIRLYYPYIEFEKLYFHESRMVREKRELQALSHKYQTIICGSDQIWAPNVLNDIYLLSFAPDEIRKISYAASIGLNEIPNNLINLYNENLRRFYSISVRENKGAQLINNLFGLNAAVVLDPTLLLDKSSWVSIEREGDYIPQENYLFCYFLKKDHNYKDLAFSVAKKRNLKIVGFSFNADDNSWMDMLSWIGPREFLHLIHNASFVLTDSYHGTIFSMIYHKEFFTIERFLRNDGICQNSRIDQLCCFFDMNSRVIPQDKMMVPLTDEFDYEQFEMKLSNLRKSSILFLNESLR